MRIFVQAPTRYPQPVDGEDVWLLVEDNWNDYGFRTLYDVYRMSQGRVLQVGGLKILKRGQKPGEVPLPRGELEGGRLPNDYGALGTSLDYYAEVRKLGRQRADIVLDCLNDLAFNVKRRALFEDEEGFLTSLHRDRNDPNVFHNDAQGVIESGGLPPEPRGWEFAFAPGLDVPSITFRFSRPDGKQVSSLEPPRRTVVLVGANGVGKTRLLASLARVAYTPPSERDALAVEGRFEGEPAFPGILAVAYSAFDTFLPPDLPGDDREQVARQLEDGTGRYAYCGMRNLPAMIRAPNEPQSLLDQRALEALFADRIKSIRTSGRIKTFAVAMAPVLSEASMSHRLPPEPESAAVESDETDADVIQKHVDRIERFLGDDPAAAFRPLSSGHKIVLHMLAGMTASLRRKGLALIDEPETHLHPPLLAALMTGVRRLLDMVQAYAIVATHSPVVVQETLASQVIIVEGQGLVRQPEIQTFGENVGALTREIFGLHTGATDYRNVLERMVKRYRDLEALEAELGESLSSQALAHVMSVLREQS